MKNKTYRRILVLVLGMSTVLSYSFVESSKNLKSNTKFSEFISTYSAVYGRELIYSAADNLYSQYGYKSNHTDFYGFGVSSMKLVNFNAVKHGNKVEIYWAATPSSNNDYFTLERSRNGVRFSKVTTIDVATNTNNVLQYCETDYEPLNGISYYRLKHTDLNKKSTYSNIVMVNYVIGDKNSMSYSNRSTNAVLKSSLMYSNNKEVLVLLKDTNGSEFYSKVVVSIDNTQIIGIDTQNRIAPGTYVVTATSNNVLYSQKLTVR